MLIIIISINKYFKKEVKSMKYKLQDLVDLDGIKKMFDKLYNFTNIPLSILDNDGNILVDTFQQDVCKFFHRANPISNLDCVKSDSNVVKRYKENKTAVIYTCPRGLSECSIPIIIEGSHLANLFMGQFFFKKPNLEYYRKQAKQFNYDETKYIEAVLKAPIISRELVNNKLEFINSFVEFLADLGLKKLNEIKLSKQIERVEEEISKREQYKLITENSSDMISLFDTKNNFIYISPSCKKIGGYEQKDIIGHSFLDFIHPDDIHLFEDLCKEMLQSKNDTYSLTFRFLNKNGKYLWVESKMHPIFDKSNSNMLEIQSSTRDISERITMHNELVTAKTEAEQANFAKSEFLANMSHEIRTPLNAVIGFSELLSATNVDTKQKSFVEAINTAGNSLLMLINDILDLSKIEAGRMEIQLSPVNVKNIFTELEQIFAQKIKSKNLKYIIDIDKTLPLALLLDETRLRQVLLNLIGNAVKFTDKGSITLKVKAFYKDSDKSRLDFKISVIDTGIGISSSEFDSIFESFKQQAGQSNRKYGGTGLGLAITKKLVGVMNGKISVSSVVNKGSTFTIELKDIDVAASDSLPSQDLSSNFSHLKFKKATVLVVDDVESNRLLIKEILLKRGLNVITAENGYDAIITAEEILPNIIIMDIRMPVMDGYEANNKLKENKKTKNIPVIALTASVLSNNNTKKSEHLFDGFLPKPVSTNKLFEELIKYLEVKEDNIAKEVLNFNTSSVQTTIVTNELKTVISEEILPIVKKLETVLKIAHVKSLANILNNTATKYNQPKLLNFSNELMGGIETYDVDIIKSITKQVLNYLENLL